MATAPPESEVVQGTVVGIIQKGADKWQIAVQPPDSQYSKNLWTKDETLVAQLSQVIGSQQSFMCGVSHWTNQSGQPVRSLWINGVGPGVAQAAPPSQPSVSAQAPGPTQAQGWQSAPPMQTLAPQQYLPPQPPPQDERETKIHRQTASKVAGILMGYLPPEVPRTYDTFMTLCERLVRYYEHGLNPGTYTPPPPDDGHHPDDNIPF